MTADVVQERLIEFARLGGMHYETCNLLDPLLRTHQCNCRCAADVLLLADTATAQVALVCESCDKPITDDAEVFDCPNANGPLHVACHARRDCRNRDCIEALNGPWEE